MTQTLSPSRTTEFEFRAVAEGELRDANDVFLEALHEEPLSDEKWATAEKAYEPGRTFGAFAGDTIVGTTTSFTSSLTVPGGAVLPMAAVTAVGVRTDHRRRGALTGLMRTQLHAAAAAGDAFATLHASEPTIYGRFGYGLGTRARIVRVRPARAHLRPDVPTAGTVRLLTTEEALSLLPDAYDRMPSPRAGRMGRTRRWWILNYERRMAPHGYFRVAAHFDADERIDGFVGYRPVEFPSRDPRTGSAIVVLDFMSTGQKVDNDLWRFLVGIDLVEELTVFDRPMDDPIEAMLTDLFAVRNDLDDELYVRIVDAPASLAARTYGDADPVPVEVVDPLLPDNSGRYLISSHGTERVDAPPALTLGPEALAMVYLGTWRPSQLAALGRLTVHDAAVLPAADRLFATEVPSWCGSLF